MFFPEQMTEVELVLPAEKAVAVTGVLAEAGVFHQIDSSYVSPMPRRPRRRLTNWRNACRP
jgi:hypothetical protein